MVCVYLFIDSCPNILIWLFWLAINCLPLINSTSWQADCLSLQQSSLIYITNPSLIAFSLGYHRPLFPSISNPTQASGHPLLSSLQLFSTTPLPTMEAQVGGSSHFPGFMIFSLTVSYSLVLYSQIQRNIFQGRNHILEMMSQESS